MTRRLALIAVAMTAAAGCDGDDPVAETCEASSDSGCAPPLEVQTWSACHRKPRTSTASELEVARGESTVVVFAWNRALARQALAALRRAKPADPSLPLTRKLRACGAR